MEGAGGIYADVNHWLMHQLDKSLGLVTIMKRLTRAFFLFLAESECKESFSTRPIFFFMNKNTVVSATPFLGEKADVTCRVCHQHIFKTHFTSTCSIKVVRAG